MSNSEIYNTRNAGMKQEVADMKNDFMKSLDNLKLDINDTFYNINDKLVTIKSGFKENLDDLVAESLSKIKDSVVEAFREENSLLHQKIEKLESRISVLETDLNKQDQYNRRNNLDRQEIPDSVTDDQLEEKVIEIFNQINAKINAFDIENCHRMGKLKKTSIALFVNRNNCKAVLEKKLSLDRKLGNEKLGFQSDGRIFVSENLFSCNQHFAWKCKELKQAGKIHSCWSAKGLVKIRRTMNRRPIAINHDTDIASLHPDFVFKVITR